MAANEGAGAAHAGPAIFQRLAGLETEYAVRFRADEPEGAVAPEAEPAARRTARPADHHLFNCLIAELKRIIPLAPAKSEKKGFFLANGGAVWHEKGRLRADSALVEGSTAECRGPRQLLAYQRAQDELLAAAARDVRVGGELTLCKSDRDAAGHAYGAQENYEVRLASGWRLRAWRAGLVLLMPAVILCYAAIVAGLILILAYWLLAALLYWPLATACDVLRRRMPMPNRPTIHAWLFGPEFGALWRGEGETFAAWLPGWLESAIYWATQVVMAPSTLGITVLAQLTAFNQVRREMLPFLVSRAVFAGSGRLLRDGSYHVATKATAVNCVASVNEIFGRRPVFSFGHLLKALMMPVGRTALGAERQRLQINLGDSNLCEEAEYLRIGTTMLVLDVIEAGEMPAVPRLWWPVRAMRRIAADPMLRTRVRLVGGRRWTALELQRFYLEACRAFLARHAAVAPPEAHNVVSRWADVLDRLERDPRELVGRVDWVTKRLLLEECGGESAPWVVRKKIDLRYHELSAEGYFQQIREAGVARRVLSEAEIDRARRTPPPDSPATERGRYIREFADSTTVQASWASVRIGTGPEARTIKLGEPLASTAGPTS